MSDLWLQEVRGLGYMILTIAQRYDEADELGGDSELLESAITQAAAYVNGPLRDRLPVAVGEAPTTPKDA